MKTERKGPAYFSYIRGNYRFTVFAQCKRLRLRSIEERGHDALGKQTWYWVPEHRWDRIIRFLAIKMVINNGERFDFQKPEPLETIPVETFLGEPTNPASNGHDHRWVVHYSDENMIPPKQRRAVRFNFGAALVLAEQFAAVGYVNITTVHEERKGAGDWSVHV